LIYTEELKSIYMREEDLTDTFTKIQKEVGVTAATLLNLENKSHFNRPTIELINSLEEFIIGNTAPLKSFIKQTRGRLSYRLMNNPSINILMTIYHTYLLDKKYSFTPAKGIIFEDKVKVFREFLPNPVSPNYNQVRYFIKMPFLRYLSSFDDKEFTEFFIDMASKYLLAYLRFVIANDERVDISVLTNLSEMPLVNKKQSLHYKILKQTYKIASKVKFAAYILEDAIELYDKENEQIIKRIPYDNKFVANDTGKFLAYPVSMIKNDMFIPYGLYAHVIFNKENSFFYISSVPHKGLIVIPHYKIYHIFFDKEQYDNFRKNYGIITWDTRLLSELGMEMHYKLLEVQQEDGIFVIEPEKFVEEDLEL